MANFKTTNNQDLDEKLNELFETVTQLNALTGIKVDGWAYSEGELDEEVRKCIEKAYDLVWEMQRE